MSIVDNQTLSLCLYGAGIHTGFAQELLGLFAWYLGLQKIIKKTKEKQKLFFIRQIELAKKLNLPIIIHNRDTKEDVFQILEDT